ncbi:MAG: 50S ribosomal protein L3 [Oscillospiraceae bacterium]|jgi:large subunit ribosomal protein L3|nr:50S ribosomal protein L3 [Oscillospiraceae bacterium]
MKKAIIGKKIGMTQIFSENGNRVPITIIEAGPCTVVQKKTVEKDGYCSVQLGFGDIKLKYKKGVRSPKFNDRPKNITLPLQGHFIKFDVAPKKLLREFKFESFDDFKVRDLIKSSIFSVGERVDVTGTSKGKGWCGVIKRWNFGRLRESHGTGPCARKGGSIGNCSNPSRVFKGKKMAGHLGAEKVTILNLEVVKVDENNNLIALKGAVPGPNDSVVVLRDSIKFVGKEKLHA